MAGGRVFPGVHNRAQFEVLETDRQYYIEMNSIDGAASIAIDGQPCDELPVDSVFDSVAQCSEFFESGSLGYSPASLPAQFDGLELRTSNWSVQAFSVAHVRSSFFEDRQAFPSGSIAFDNALLMRGIEHKWRSRETICYRND